MKTKLLLAGLLSAGLPTHGQTVLQNEHVDIGIAYEDGAWDLHIHDEDNDVEYEPGDAILQVNAGAETTVSSNPLFNFLGTAGSATWILPAVEDPSLLFLGFGAEEIESGLFVGDTLNMYLRGVSGPGEFALFDFDGLTGDPRVFMNSRDGFTAADLFVAPAGGHTHLNWAFSAPGTYTVSFEASGILADGNVFTSSGPVDYTFHVVPEPDTWALLGLGALGLVFCKARRRAANA
jgi:surface-anchored protein